MTEGLDMQAELGRVLGDVGLSPDDTGGKVTFIGADPIVDSPLLIGGTGAVALAARAAAAAILWRDRSGEGQDITVDLVRAINSVSPIFRQDYITLHGLRLYDEDPGNAFNMSWRRTRDGRHVMANNSYPGIRDRMAAVLGCRNSEETVTEAIGRWDARDLEEAAQTAGAACAMARTVDEWHAEPHSGFIDTMPLIALERIGDSDPEPLGPGDRPLSGVRALGMAHVLAGPQFGTVLAEQGADVLNVWSPRNYEPLRTYCLGDAGLRSTTLDGSTEDGRRHLTSLVGGADIFFANRRPAKIASLGLSAEECAQTRPGIVHVSYSCFGEEGPWSSWAGFDPHAQAVTGISLLGGVDGEPRTPPTVIYNDLVSAWLGAVGAMAALRRRAVEGGSWRVRISLARCSTWLRSFGLVDHAPGDLPDLPEPELREADTPLGRYRYMPSQVEMSATPPWFEYPLVVKGASRPEWVSAAR